jgi:hypothetical protein
LLKILLPWFLFTLYDCGGSYRWDNKILIDAAGLKLFPKRAKASTIHTVTHYQRPPNEQLGAKRGTLEQKKVTVTAWLVGLGKEDNDNDYHLILTSLNSADSMIAEIPDPTCPKLEHFPGLRDKYTIARTFIEEEVDDSPGNIHYIDTPVKVKVTGVLFFDRSAHGNGHSHNGVEIHPVMKIVRAGQ